MAILKQKVSGVAIDRTVIANYDDNMVVHKSGNETVAGTKTFSDSPLVPTVVDATDNSQKAASTAFVQAVMNKMFDAMYPVGSYAFGVMPALGTWEEVEGDRALWLKNTVDDGTTIAQQLPNIRARAGMNYIVTDGYVPFADYEGAFHRTDESAGSTARKWPNAGSLGDGRRYPHFRFDASKSNNVYQDGANVQPNAYVMKVYKRVA